MVGCLTGYLRVVHLWRDKWTALHGTLSTFNIMERLSTHKDTKTTLEPELEPFLQLGTEGGHCQHTIKLNVFRMKLASDATQ